MNSHRPLYYVLLVEDNAVLATCAAEYLTRRGLQVDTASSTERAFECLSEQPYDAVITDLDLTGTGRPDGLAVVAAAASARPRPAVLVWTGSSSGLVDQEARRLGADAVLEKPGLAELAHALASHLGTPHVHAAAGSASFA